MNELSALERAVLHEIEAHTSEPILGLAQQIEAARVVARENTGSGFFTTFDVGLSPLLEGVRSPIGFVMATIDGLQHGMGFLLWIRNDRVYQLEGYSNAGEDTSGLNLSCVESRDVVSVIQ